MESEVPAVTNYLVTFVEPFQFQLAKKGAYRDS